MTGAHEMLVPVFEPFYRSSHLPRQERDQQILGINMSLDAKSAADVQRNATNAGLRHLEDGRCFPAQPMNDLACGPDSDRIRSLVMYGGNAAALHRYRGVTVMVEPALHPVRRFRERRFHFALCHLEIADHVRVVLLMQYLGVAA